MTNPNQLTRVCTSCGIKKPLAAFLQLSENQGTTYGAICSDCRRTSARLKQQSDTKDAKDTEGQTSSDFRIGARAKITADREKQRQRETIVERYEDESKKKLELNTEKLSQSEIKQKLEKQHKVYIDAKKRGFLSSTNKKTIADKQTFDRQKTTGHLVDQHHTEQTNLAEAKKTEALQHELKLTTIDLTLPFLDPQFSEIRHQSKVFLQFKQWLGAGAPMAKVSVMKALERIYNQSQTKLNKFTISDKKNIDQKRDTQSPLVEYVEKQIGPSSSRKR
jgi:hypothetical protein